MSVFDKRAIEDRKQREQQDAWEGFSRTETLKQADNERGVLRWDGEAISAKMSQQSDQAAQWVKTASGVNVRPELAAAAKSAADEAEKVADLVRTTSKRVAEARDRLDATAALVNAARLRALDAQGLVNAGTTDANEAVRNHLELVAATAERNCLERQYTELHQEASTGAKVRAQAFAEAVEFATTAALELQQLNDTWGPTDQVKAQAAAWGETVRSTVELGYIAIELAKFAEVHKFLELHPRRDFETIARCFEDSAARKLGLFALAESKPATAGKGIRKTIKTALGIGE